MIPYFARAHAAYALGWLAGLAMARQRQGLGMRLYRAGQWLQPAQAGAGIDRYCIRRGPGGRKRRRKG